MKKALNTGLILIGTSIILSSCTALKNIVNRELPKLSTIDQQINAIDQASLSVESIKPSAGVFISSKMVQEFFPNELDKLAMSSEGEDYEIKSFKSMVSLDKQAVVVEGTFSIDVESIKANVKGELSGLAGLSSLKDTVYLFGAFSSIQITDITHLSDSPGLGNRAKAKLLKPILKNFLARVNAKMFEEQITIYSGLGAAMNVNISEMFSDPNTTVLSSPENLVTRAVETTSFLVNEEGIRVVLEFTPNEATTSMPSSNSQVIGGSSTKRELKIKFNEYLEKFNHTWLGKFDSIPVGANLSVYLSKSEIASIFNDAMKGEISIAHNIVVPESKSKSELGLEEKKIDCDELKKPFSYPSFDGRSCNWSCRRSGPFGTSYDDPFCLASREACRVRREAERVIWQAGRESARILRQAENEATVLACNIAREANNFMNLGDARTTISGSGLLTLDLSGINFSNNLERLSINQSGDLGLNFKTKIELNPQDLGYIFLCFSDYTKRLNTEALVSIPSQTSTLDFNALHLGDKLILTSSMNSIDYEAEIRPNPTFELLSDIEFSVKCKYLHTALGIASVTSFTDLIKYSPEVELFLEGKTKSSYEIPSFSQTIEPILFKINSGVERKALPHWSTNCISFTYK